MLDGLKADDHIYRRVADRQCRGVAATEGDALRQIVVVREPDGGGVEIHPDNAARYLADQCSTITLAARNIEHLPVMTESERKKVAVVMLALNVAEQTANVALPGELQW